MCAFSARAAPGRSDARDTGNKHAGKGKHTGKAKQSMPTPGGRGAALMIRALRVFRYFRGWSRMMGDLTMYRVGTAYVGGRVGWLNDKSPGPAFHRPSGHTSGRQREAWSPAPPAPPGMSRGPPMRIRCRVQLVFVYVLRLASSSRQLHGNAPRAGGRGASRAALRRSHHT